MPTERITIAMIAELTKWKLSLAVAFSAVTGFLICSSDATGGLIPVAAGVFLLSSGAAALNQYTERKSDALMERTARRPLPSGRITPGRAVAVAVPLLVSGALLLGISGLIPLILGLVNVLLYNIIYTSLKRVTSLAIVPGALVGAVPPLIGYTAAGGSPTDTVILLFALFMFLWQIPHFWLLLARYGSEYEKAGIRTIYGSMSLTQINRLILIWITGSSVLLWILAAVFMPFSKTAALLLLLLNVAFILAFAGIIRTGYEGVRSRYAFIAFNSFSILVMLILIVFA